MQEKSMSELMDDAFNNPQYRPTAAKKEVRRIAKTNRTALAKVDLPDSARIPSVNDLEDMRKYAIAYKKAMPNASKREVRKAVQEKFNIKIFRSGNKTITNE